MPLSAVTQRGESLRAALLRALGAGAAMAPVPRAAPPEALTVNVNLGLDGLRASGSDRRSIVVKRDRNGAMIGAEVTGESESVLEAPGS